ncbi:MAG TPA: dihydrofolate reductase, partial [Pirellulaceae bacterium]|nr:dihydrofolate reductase [Pirellulaceae bacterium]
PLPGRTSIVLTRQTQFVAAEGVLLASNLDAALALARERGDDEAFVIGGAEIYRLALPRCDRAYVTRVAAEVDGDTWLEGWDESQWHLEAAEPHSADDKNEYDFTFETYSRVVSSKNT